MWTFFPYIRSWTNFWMVGMGYTTFWYIVFAVYCIHYQYTQIRIYKLRKQRIEKQDDTILYKHSTFNYLDKVIRIPWTTEMISIRLVLFTIVFSLVNLYFAIFFVAYKPAPYHPGIIDRRAAFTGLVDWSFVFFLVQRNSIIPKLSGLSFEELIPMHRIIARIGTLNFMPHLIYRMWEGYWKHQRYWDMFFKDFEYTTGTVAMWASITMILTSFEYIRRHHFEVFYYCHIFFAIVTITGTLFHYNTCFAFFLPPTFLWLFDRLVRTWKSRFVPSSFVQVEQVAAQTENQEGIVRITIENKMFSNFYPGQYVFVAMIIRNSFWEHWHWHPFTVSEIFHVPTKQRYEASLETHVLNTDVASYSSIPAAKKDRVHLLRQRHQLSRDSSQSSYATIHIKALGTKTRQLLESLGNEKKHLKIYLDGLYGPRLPYQDFRVLGLFATGIGVTPALVIMKDVIDKRYQEIYSVSVHKIYLTWSIRHTDEIEPFLDLFLDWCGKSKKAILPIQLYISVYVTRMKTSTKQIPLPFQFYYGNRPNVKGDMDRIRKENNSSVWTHVCGSTPFTRDVINQAVDHRFQVHHETFEF